MAAAGALTEPTVLAATKQELFSPETDDQYVVADTQFAKNEWLDGQPISADTKSILAPFNHVQVGSGYPDLVGVNRLDTDLLVVLSNCLRKPDQQLVDRVPDVAPPD